MMTAQPLDRWPKWRDELVYHLRMEDIPGDRIGDILLEADAHLRESGETPEDAFGEPKLYAATRATVTGSREYAPRLWLIAIGAFAGSYLTVDGAMNLGRGEASALFLPPWLTLVIGLALLLVTLRNVPDDLVRHPATGQPLFRERPVNGQPLFRDYPAVRYILLAVVAIAAVALFFFGRMLG